MTKQTKPRGSKITLPKRAHPLARLLFQKMAEKEVTYDALEAASGIKKSAFKATRTHNAPGADSIQAMMRVLGLNVLPVPTAGVLPAALRADLEAVGKRHGIPFPAAQFIAVAAARELPALAA